MAERLPYLIILDFPWAKYAADDIQCAIVQKLKRGYRILKISEFPVRTQVKKVKWGDSVAHDEVSLGDNDSLENAMWTRVWMER